MQPLETLLEEFHTKLQEIADSTPRLAKFPHADNLIKVAIGMRRTGKTYFLYQIIQSLLNKGVPLDSILYISFEDARLFPMDHKEMASLLEDFYTLYPENHQRQCYLFLDELQNIDGWE